MTLILYSIDWGDRWYSALGREPVLNLLAAAAQLSSFTHVEIALGESATSRGEMCNVLRIFNDDVGVELTSRTGTNPQYSYVQIGCTSEAVDRMIAWAKMQVGKPFSSIGMARSVIWPRKTDEKTWFCAELVAACLQHGGLMSKTSAPGHATPKSLYNTYKLQGAVAGNPYKLRHVHPVPRPLSYARVFERSEPAHTTHSPFRVVAHGVPRSAFDNSPHQQPTPFFTGMKLDLSKVGPHNRV